MSKYKVCFDAPKDRFAANINMVVEQVSGTLAKYVASNIASLQGTTLLQKLKIIKQEPFTTKGGVSGVRIVLTDLANNFDLQQIFYLFAGAGDTKYVLTGTCLSADGPHYAPIFDASAQTFSPQ